MEAAKELIVNAFPGEGLRLAGLLLQMDSSLGPSADQLFGFVQEHFDVNFLPVTDQVTGDVVLVSGYSRVFTGIGDSEELSRFGVYWNPRTQTAYTVDFARLEIVERVAADLSPSPARLRLEEALNTRFHVFSPPMSGPLLMALTSRNFCDSQNFTAGYVLNQFEVRTSTDESGQSDWLMQVESSETEIRALHYEDAVACLTISVRHQPQATCSSARAEEAASLMQSIDGSRQFDSAEISDRCCETLKSLRRLLPVHKQQFDWNINRVAMLLLPISS